MRVIKILTGGQKINEESSKLPAKILGNVLLAAKEPCGLRDFATEADAGKRSKQAVRFYRKYIQKQRAFK